MKKQAKQARTTGSVLGEALSDSYVEVPVDDLALLFVQAARRKKERELISALRESTRSLPAAVVLMPRAVVTLLRSLMVADVVCGGQQHTTKPRIYNVIVELAGGNLRVRFRFEGNNKKCTVTPIAVSVARGTAPAVGMSGININGGVSISAGTAPSSWQSGDQVKVTVTFKATNKEWCDTCVPSPVTVSKTVWIA